MSRTILFNTASLIEKLENGLLLGETLLFPEVSRLASSRGRLLGALRSAAATILTELRTEDLHMRSCPAAVEQGSIDLRLRAPEGSGLWREPLELRFDIVHYSTAGEPPAAVAYVPALGIEVVGATREQVERRLEDECLAELMRRRATLSLAPLIWLQRTSSREVVTQSVSVPLPRAKDAARAERREPEKKPTLPAVATKLSALPLPAAFLLDCSPLARALHSAGGRAVLLVGPSGAGKTAMFYELARTRAARGFGAYAFWETSGSRIMGGGGGFGAWQERCIAMWREAAASPSVLFLGNLVELIEVGRHETNPQGIAGFLRPFLARDEVPVVVECTPEQRTLLERDAPHVLTLFRPMAVESSDDETLRVILDEAAAHLVAGSATSVEPGALEITASLHRRFATYSAPPGRPLRFLRAIVQDAVDACAARVTAHDAAEAFARETGLPSFLLDPRVGFDVAAARAWFRTRLAGQEEPISLVADALAAVKASLNRPHRPIASFLFIGPTGVGKTEMARCLAEFLFGNRRRMARFDMSEYADEIAVQRLVGGCGRSEGLLTAAVREHPFSVVLFDEVEKAHPFFFDLLLQVLGEARLTDSAGRLADFRNAVIIMTSNIGAAAASRPPLGFLSAAQRDATPREAARSHFVAEVRSALRPELFNRIDRIVPFAPLDREIIEEIALRELDALRMRDGILYREVQFEVGEGVASYLAERGTDARYGARPLKRAVEREVLAPLAAALNRYGDEHALRAILRMADGRIEVDVRAAHGPCAVVRRRDSRIIRLVEEISGLRLRCARLSRSPAARELQSELYRLEQPRRGWISPKEALREEARKRRLRVVRDDLDRLTAETEESEDEAMLALHAKGAWDHEAMEERAGALSRRMRQASLALYEQRFAGPGFVVAVYGSPLRFAYEIASIYLRIMLQRGLRARLAVIVTARERDEAGDVQRMPGDAEPSAPSESGGRRRRKGRSPEGGERGGADAAADEEGAVAEPREWSKVLVDDAAGFLSQRRGDLLGLALGFEEPTPAALLEGEAGLHLVTLAPDRTERAVVVVEETTLEEYRPANDVARKGWVGGAHARRRAVSFVSGQLDDGLLGRSALSERTLEEAMGDCIEGALTRRIESMLEGVERE